MAEFETPKGEELSRIPFGPEAEAQILSLSFWLKALGIINIVSAVLSGLPAIGKGELSSLLNTAIYIFIGVSALDAGQAFRMVATTDTADQSYLVSAFRKLRGIFLLQAVVIILGIALFCVVVGLIVLAAVIGAISGGR